MGGTKQQILRIVWFVRSIILVRCTDSFWLDFWSLDFLRFFFSHLLGDGEKRRSIPADSEMSAGCCFGLTDVNLLVKTYQVPRGVEFMGYVSFSFSMPSPKGIDGQNLNLLPYF